MIEHWMIPIPQGEISLRDDRKKTAWTSEVKPFLMSKYLVTQEVYSEVMSKRPSKFSGLKKPVESVAWFDAIQFCNALSELSGLDKCYFIRPDNESVDL